MWNVCVAILVAAVLNAVPADAATLTHGPIIGDVTPDHVQVWGRTSGAAAVTIEYLVSGQAFPGTVLPAATVAGSDYTFALQIPGLAPDTAYLYRVIVDGVVPSTVRTFRTAAPIGDGRDLAVAFVSDAFDKAASTVWGAVDAQAPDGFFIIGDFDHSNPATNTASAAGYLTKLRDMHRRLRGPETPIGNDFVTHMVEHDVPLLGRILDDHDSGSDNVDSRFKWWAPNLQAFLEYHPVPADNGFASGGMWQAIQRGRALFIVLDLRSHRVSTGAKTILGTAQKEWLTTKLEQCATDSNITWCVIVSTVPYNPNQQKLDSWHGFPADQQWLLDQVKNVRNVLVVSGDCHWGSIVRPPLSPLVELNIPQANPGFSNTCNNNAAQWTQNSPAAGTGFGLLTLGAHEAVLEIYNADGTLRFGTTVPEGGSSPTDRDGDGVPDSTDACPDVPGVAPSGCPVAPPGGGDVTMTFTRTDNGGQRYDVSVPPYICARRTGGTSLLQIIKVTNGVEALLKSTPVSNPAINVPFTLRCQVTTAAPATITLSLDGVVKLSIPAQ